MMLPISRSSAPWPTSRPSSTAWRRPSWAADDAAMADAISKVDVPEFKPKSGVKIETDPKATAPASHGMDDEAIIEDLLGKLEQVRLGFAADYRLSVIEFEKDDDTNFHMDADRGPVQHEGQELRHPGG